MKQNDMYNLVLGAAVVAIVYMVLKQKKTAPVALTPAVKNDVTNAVLDEWLSTITFG